MRLVPDQWPRGELVYNFRCSNSLAHLFSTVWGRGQGWTQGRLVMSTVVPPPSPPPRPCPLLPTRPALQAATIPRPRTSQNRPTSAPRREQKDIPGGTTNKG